MAAARQCLARAGGVPLEQATITTTVIDAAIEANSRAGASGDTGTETELTEDGSESTTLSMASGSSRRTLTRRARPTPRARPSRDRVSGLARNPATRPLSRSGSQQDEVSALSRSLSELAPADGMTTASEGPNEAPVSRDAMAGAPKPSPSISLRGLWCSGARWEPGVGLSDPVEGRMQHALPTLRMLLITDEERGSRIGRDEDAVAGDLFLCPVYHTASRGWLTPWARPGDARVMDISLNPGAATASHWALRNVAVLCQAEERG